MQAKSNRYRNTTYVGMCVRVVIPFVLDVRFVDVPAGVTFSLFLYKMCGLVKLGLVDQNWLERNFSGFLLRTLIGDNIPSRSRLLSNGVRRFDEPF